MKTITGPRSSSFVQLLNWIFRPLDYQEECRQKYGDTFRLNLTGLPPFTVISNPQEIQAVFSIDGQKFDVGRTNGLASSLLGDRPVVPKRRGGTVAPHNGVPLKVKAKREVKANLASSIY